MKLLTAHDLLTGEVVYLTANGKWATAIADARLMEDADADAALKAAQASETVVVNPYLVAMDGKAAPIARERVREDMRAKGPSVHPGFQRDAGGAR
ncbi:MAG: DUF2849 domain-containing protein [Hyphomonadaceae bacterium]